MQAAREGQEASDVPAAAALSTGARMSRNWNPGLEMRGDSGSFGARLGFLLHLRLLKNVAHGSRDSQI